MIGQRLWLCHDALPRADRASEASILTLSRDIQIHLQFPIRLLDSSEHKTLPTNFGDPVASVRLHHPLCATRPAVPSLPHDLGCPINSRMRLEASPPRVVLFIILLFPSLCLTQGLDCTHARADKQSWNFGDLDGPVSVMTSEDHAPSPKLTNTTFTVDVCKPLQKAKGIPKDEDCPNGTRGMLIFASFRL